MSLAGEITYAIHRAKVEYNLYQWSWVVAEAIAQLEKSVLVEL